ncbi:phenylalanine--tRNA ligase subunit beta [Hyphomonas sp. FCG-A18]|uniref:phenylalanine--tRNA ligase subunit beta n=1 Tax=Hyphomonas sp. FCG-A18 TaxID=3080019 RepID=UPI002B2A7CF7|nr:phenylalanine--tRNA ligase subunit beta [Hyphomonas sp. FCG-A18]
MKYPLSWLKDYLSTSASLDEILGFMLKAGLEVEHVDNPAEDLAAFTVAKVKTAEPHPDADKLRICTVETVDGEKQIVCGAPNARAGMTAIYAPLGTYIPGLDFSLDKKPRKIRGVESSGMMCSTKELNAGEDHDGIADLDASIPLGTPAAQALGLDDPVIDFEVTPNRPDWLGVKGIARDLAAAGAGLFLDDSVKKVSGGYDCPVEIKLDAPDACPVFAGALVKGVKNGPSPDWMQARLKAIGITPKSLLVDITNYISIDRARPLHVYDADKLKGPVRARLGEQGETLEALDGKTYDITADMCVIADDSGVIGLGGVMGGESTAVTDETVNVFIESAWFDPLRTAKTGRVTGIISDARYRFERGVDPQSCLEGLNLALKLILEYGGGTASKANLAGEAPRTEDKVEFHKRDVARLTGLELKSAAMKKTLKTLGFAIEDTGETWLLDAPSWRFDMEQSADIVEEIARLEGYDALPTLSLPAPETSKRVVTTALQDRVRTARRTLASRGFLEAVTWSFMPKAQAKLFGGGEGVLTVANPVASELNQMRPSVLANLATAAQKGADNGERELRLFEAGPIYLNDGPKDQRTVVSALVRPAKTRHWQGSESYDAYAAKADLFAVLEALGQPPERFQIEGPRQKHWHPGQSACLKLGPKVTIAHFGALHPGVLKQIGVDGPAYGFELNLNALPQMKAKATKTKAVLDKADLTPIHRDFAFVVTEDIAAGAIVKAAKGADKTLITDTTVFDVYQGTGIEEGHKSVAIEVTLQPKGEALKDKDIEAISDKIIKAVAKATGGVLRG